MRAMQRHTGTNTFSLNDIKGLSNSDVSDSRDTIAGESDVIDKQLKVDLELSVCATEDEGENTE